MRTQHLITLFLLGLLTLTGCNTSIVEKRATGLPYEVLVVMTKEVNDSEVGELVRAQLNTPVAGLPQIEPSMRITYAPVETFNGLLRYVRNILLVDIDPAKYTTVSMKTSKDEWATNQEVIKLNAPSTEELVTYLLFHDSDIVNLFSKVERERRVAILKKDYSQLAMDKVNEKFGIRLHAPNDMTYYKDTTDFLWVSNNAKTGRVDLLVYSFPYTDENTFTEDYLVAKRDSVLKVNLPGAFPDSYMATERRAALSYEPITLDNQYCGVLRGLWKMVGDKMGGPFVSHAFLDERSQRIVVTEGLVFAPETTKRNLIRKIEAALYTVNIPKPQVVQAY